MSNTEYHGPIFSNGRLLWGLPDSRAAATIRINLDGRTRLIKGLTKGDDSIEVYGVPGEVYLRSIEGYPLD